MSQEDIPETQADMPQARTEAHAWVAYAAPMALFLVLTALEGWLVKLVPYFWIYSLKAILVTLALLAFHHVWKGEIRWEARLLLPAAVTGLAVFAEWVLVEKYVPYPHLGTRTAFNPFVEIAAPGMRLAFLLIRFYGLAILVPIMEEVFWRSFLLRWLARPEFTFCPVGYATPASFALVVLAFSLAHPEWLAAALCAVAYGFLVVRTRSLLACILAHAITNLALGLYVVCFHVWNLW